MVWKPYEWFCWKQTFLFSHNFESDFISPQEYGEAFVEFYLQREIELINNFDKIVVCSETDRRKYQVCMRARDIDILLCSNGSFIEPSAVNFSNRISNKCLYIGSHWPSNVEGIERIIRHNPGFLENYEINLVGSIEKAFPKINRRGLIFHEVLSENELLEIASKCSFAVNPVFSGGGSNVKNADYLALGLQS